MNSAQSWSVKYDRKALKELAKLDKQVARRIANAVDNLANDPRPPRCRPLSGYASLWRIRVGDYRVIYTVRDDELIVLVLRIAHRSAAYQNL